MSRPLTPEQLAKREALKNRTTEEVYQGAVKRGLESNVSAERVAAIKAYADERNPGIIEMKDRVKQAEDDREASESALKTAQTALDAANAKVAELEPLAAQLPDVTAQYNDLKANLDVRVAAMREELVAEAQQHRWAAERAEHAADDKVREADNKVSASGWTELRQTLADLIARYEIPQPDFWSTSSTMPSAFWELWGWGPEKAKVYTAYKAGYKEPSPAFRAQLLRHLKATLPLQTFIGMEPPAPIENLSEKIACMTEQAKLWNVWADIAREFERLQVEKQTETLRTHYAAMHAEEQAAALSGAGRSPIGEAEPESITGYTGPHDPLCCCGRPGCNPLPAHLRPFEIEEKL